MASSLLSSGTLGNVSASSLVRSAGTLQREIATFQDNAARIAYENSGHTDEAYQAYVNYLQGRVKTLAASSSITDLNKAQSLQQEIVTATHSNVSYQIQQENMRLMATGDAGTVAGYQSKMQVVADEFSRATAIGDNTLAYSLQNQYYSLSQSMQQAQTTAATAYAANEGKSWADTATGLKSALDKFNTDYANAGRKAATGVIADFVKSIQPELAKAGIHLSNGVQPNYFDIVDGVNRAIYKAYQNAATVEAPYDTTGTVTNDYLNKANNTITSVSTIYGTMSAQQLQSAQADPGQFSYREDPQYVTGDQKGGAGGKQNPQTGYQLLPTGIQATFSQSPWLDIPNNLNNQIQALKLRVVTTQGNGVEVTATDQSPQWLKNLLPADATTHLLSDANGQLQFEADAQNGNGKAIYTIAKDNTIWESSSLGDRLISGTPANPTSENFLGTARDAFVSSLSRLNTLFNAGGNLIMGHASAATLPAGMLPSSSARSNLPPLPVSATPMQLPHLSVAPPAATPHIQVAPVANPYPQAQTTVNPQPATPGAIVQGGSQGISLQGFGGISLQGGGGLRLQ